MNVSYEYKYSSILPLTVKNHLIKMIVNMSARTVLMCTFVVDFLFTFLLGNISDGKIPLSEVKVSCVYTMDSHYNVHKTYIFSFFFKEVTTK